MARTARKVGAASNGSPTGQTGDETVTGYFRRLFRENPALLETRSNEEMLQRYLGDHPHETEISQKIKVAMSNAKSSVRATMRKKRRGRPPKAAVTALAAPPVAVKPVRHVAHASRLETLEEQIDDCLSVAKKMDRESLADVIKLLRRARNEVVWKLGQ
jgi:hypothetical protein